MKSKILLLVLALSTAAALAQELPNKGLAEPGPFGANVCQSTFTFGSGHSYMSFCVTANGNIAKLESPATFSQIFAEGYGVCDTTNSSVSYHDHEYVDSGNWASSTLIQPNGANTFPLKIVRTTSDGIWTLTQTFSRDTKDQIVKIVMTLKNNTAADRTGYLQRYADVDADGNASVNYSDAGWRSAWTYYNDNYGGKGHGLTLRALPDNFTAAGAVILPDGSGACYRTERTGPYFGDAAIDYRWYLGLVPANSSKTVTVEYRAM